MNSNITSYTVSSLLFLMLLIASGSLSGIASEMLYIAAFVIPLLVGIYADKRRRAREAEEDREYPADIGYFSLTREGVGLFAPLVFPTVALVFLLSFLTSLLISSVFGVSGSVDVGDNFAFALIRHALIPAILEEALFRYLPIKMLSRYSTRVTVLLSSLYFAFVHASFFSMPYAFLAGFIFITADLVCGSVLPSVVMHFANNVVSLLWIFCSGERTFVICFSVALAVLTTVSLVLIFLKRHKYTEKLSSLAKIDDTNANLYEAFMLAVVAVILAVEEII